MKRFQIASVLFMTALCGIMGIAFANRPDTAQVIVVTPLDRGDVTYTPDFAPPEYLECVGDCACTVYSFDDIEGTHVNRVECGYLAYPTTSTPPPLMATPTAVADGPTLTPTIQKVIGVYCFGGSTFQHIRQAPVSTAVSVGRLYPNQCVEVVSVVTLPSGDMWLGLGAGRFVAYRVNGYQFGSYTQIVGNQ